MENDDGAGMMKTSTARPRTPRWRLQAAELPAAARRATNMSCREWWGAEESSAGEQDVGWQGAGG